jgi:hypothetical protein
MLWYDRNYEEELGWAAESWILSQQNSRLRLEEDSVVVKLARGILNKLLESELAKGLKLKLYVVDDYRKFVQRVGSKGSCTDWISRTICVQYSCS